MEIDQRISHFPPQEDNKRESGPMLIASVCLGALALLVGIGVASNVARGR